jgi:exoribonuclease R
MWTNETQRGAIRVEFPQQDIVADPDAPGGVRLIIRARNYAELVNSTLSLAVNLALGQLCKDAGVGLFRVMDEPNTQAIKLLRRSAHALGIVWKPGESLRDLQRRMDANNWTHQRFLLEARRSSGRASYASFSADKMPWHSAIGGVYVHATAPMRRLADRYVLDLSYALANGRQIEPRLVAKLAELPTLMQRFEARAANVDQAVIDLLEAVSLQHRIGETIEAEVIDAQLGIVQTIDPAVRTKILQLPADVKEGDRLNVRIDAADPIKRRVSISVAS